MRKSIFAVALAALCLPLLPALAQENKEKDPNPEEIIKRFAAKEAEFKEARSNYTYRQTVNLKEIDPQPTGQWFEVDDIIFNTQGKRTEVVIKAPVQDLKHITLTPEDAQDLREVQPFVLTTAEIGQYNINYLGREKLDEIGCFTFSVKPKKMEKGKRYFEGEIWVDDRDMQIVKTYGKGVGIVAKGNEFPKFETYREQIDGKYWFPTYTHADDTLHFPGGENVHIQETVKYQDYKRFEGRSTITYGGAIDDKKDTAPPPTKKK